jgi:RNA polymerase sigma factor (sigma-70 family)
MVDRNSISETLWLRFKEGDPAAFDELAKKFYRTLYHYASKFSNDSDFIRDCLQELFLDLWEHRANLTKVQSPKAYLFTALRHKIVRESEYLKRFQHSKEIAFAQTEVDHSVEHRLVDDEEQRLQLLKLHRQLSQLSRRQQEALYLRFFENLDNEAIATIMGMTRPSVANLISGTLKELKENWSSIKLLTTLLMFVFEN